MLALVTGYAQWRRLEIRIAYGKRSLSTQSGTPHEVQYSFGTRFENGSVAAFPHLAMKLPDMGHPASERDSRTVPWRHSHIWR